MKNVITKQPEYYEDIELDDIPRGKYADAAEGLTKSPSTGYGLADAGMQMFELGDGKTDKLRDDTLTKLVSEGIVSGRESKDIFNSMDEPNKQKGIYYKKLIDSGVEGAKAMKLANVRPSQVERANQGFFENFIDGVQADHTMLAFGIREAVLPDDPELQAERALYVNRYNKDNEFRKGYLSEYDEDGDRDEPWNWGAGFGEIALDVAAGFGAGKGAKTLMQAGVRDTMFSTSSEYLK